MGYKYLATAKKQKRCDKRMPSTISRWQSRHITNLTECNRAYVSNGSNASRTMYQELNDTMGIALALHHLADIAWTRGDLETARDQGEEAFEIFSKMNDIASVAYMQLHLATLAIDQGDYTKGCSLLEENLN